MSPTTLELKCSNHHPDAKALRVHRCAGVTAKHTKKMGIRPLCTEPCTQGAQAAPRSSGKAAAARAGRGFNSKCSVGNLSIRVTQSITGDSSVVVAAHDSLSQITTVGPRERVTRGRPLRLLLRAEELPRAAAGRSSPRGRQSGTRSDPGCDWSRVDETAAVIELRAVLVCDVPDVASVAEAKAATEA